MMNNLIQTGIAFLSFIMALLSFYFALRTEIKKNYESLISARLDEEKRNAAQDSRLALMEERYAHHESLMAFRIDDINKKLEALMNAVFISKNEVLNEK